MKQMRTRDLVKILKRMGCVKGETVGSHTKWTAPEGHATSVVEDTDQAAGTLRNIQAHLAPEFGEKWLEKERKK